jgi:hypothetical protein
LRERIWITRRISESRRIHPPAAGLLDQVAAVLLERLVGPLGGGAGDALAAPHLGEDLEEALARDTVLAQGAACAGPRSGVDHREEDVLDRHVVVLEPLGLLLGGVEDLVERTRDVDLPGSRAGAADPRPGLEVALQRGAHGAGVDLEPREQTRDQAIGVVEQPEQQVLGVDLRVPEAQRLGLRVVQGLLGLLREPVRIHVDSPHAALRWRDWRGLKLDTSASSSNSSRSCEDSSLGTWICTTA